MKPLDQVLTYIAREHLSIQTLNARMSDALDFHNVAVWQVEIALTAAFEAGTKAASPQGNSDHSQSVVIDFEGERLRKAATQLLAALQEAVAEIELLRANLLSEDGRRHPSSSGWARVYDKAKAAIAAANAALSTAQADGR
jgi:hypothetical protein